MTNRALLVVDMQNGFCHPDGSFSQIGMGLDGAQDAVRNAAVAVEAARRAAIPVVFTRHVYRPGRADEGRALIRNSPALAGVNGLAAGFWDADVVDELGCGPEDLVVDKVRFDAFQWTSLKPLLRGLGVTELIVCGVVTNLCVETTVRSAFMRDYPVTLLADCCAAKTRHLHELSIEVLTSYELAEIAHISDGFDVGALSYISQPRTADQTNRAKVSLSRTLICVSKSSAVRMHLRTSVCLSVSSVFTSCRSSANFDSASWRSASITARLLKNSLSSVARSFASLSSILFLCSFSSRSRAEYTELIASKSDAGRAFGARALTWIICCCRHASTALPLPAPIPGTLTRRPLDSRNNRALE